jgi:hypothetical protein
MVAILYYREDNLGAIDTFMNFRRLLAKKMSIKSWKILIVACTLPVHFWLGLDSEIFAAAGGGRVEFNQG